MIGVVVRIQSKPGEEQVVEDQMKAFASECIEKEPGTLLYTIVRDDDGLGTMEIYQDEAAFRAHGATPHHAENVRILSDKVADVSIKASKVLHHPTR